MPTALAGPSPVPGLLVARRAGTTSPAPSRRLGDVGRTVSTTAATKADPEPAADRDPRGPADGGTRIGFLVHDVSRMRRTLYDQTVKPLGLTRSQWWVLAQLSRQMAPDGMPQTELAKLLDIGKVTIGGLVDRLEERGFVERRADRTDRRAKRVFVTADGRKILRRMVQLSSDLNAVIYKGFDEEDMRVVERVLDRMKGNIRAALEER